MSERTGWDERLSVTADGKGLVGHAGAVLLRKLADRVGLTAALAEVLPSGVGPGRRERAPVVVQLAVAIVPGARNLSEAEALQAHHQHLFGPAVSDSTTGRTLAAFDTAVVNGIARTRARVRPALLLHGGGRCRNAARLQLPHLGVDHVCRARPSVARVRRVRRSDRGPSFGNSRIGGCWGFGCCRKEAFVALPLEWARSRISRSLRSRYAYSLCVRVQ
ncbi:hypothetical protein [Streptomyces sp. NPDC058394]|uniref:hypothetical protein n=1 Tax=Streptomyces sp. NPDC058394 TaxID=3346477 RepID=UPI00364D961A